MIKAINKYKLLHLPFIFLIVLLLYIRFLFIFSYSVDIDGLEYYFLHLVQEMLNGQRMYGNPMEFPYSINLYTPVYFYLFGISVRLSNLNIYNDIHQMLVLGRMLSFSIVLLQLIYLVKLVRKFSTSTFISIIVLALYLLFISGHIYAVRPDALKILFFIMFVYYLTKSLFYSDKLLPVILCLTISILAVYTKQDISIYITLCFVVAFHILRSKKVIRMYATFVVLCLGMWVAIGLRYGSYIFQNMVLFNVQSVVGLAHSYNLIFIIFSLFRTLPLFFIVILNHKKLKKTADVSGGLKFIVQMSMILFPVTYLSLMRPGGNLNYTYELSVFLTINFGLFLHLNTDKINLHKKIYGGVLLIYVLFLVFTNGLVKSYYFDQDKQRSYKTEYYNYLRDRDSIKEIIQNDTIFFPNTKYSVFYFDKPVVLGHDMHLDRFIKLYTNLDSVFNTLTIKTTLPYINTKRYDDNFKDGTVKYIIIDSSTESVQHVSFYYPMYSPCRRVGNMLIYKYKHTM